MAEGDTPSAAELAAAIEKLDTVIAKQKELLKIRQQDAKVAGDLSEQIRIQAELREKDLLTLSQLYDKGIEYKDLTDNQKSTVLQILGINEDQKNNITELKVTQEQILQVIAQQRAQQELIRDTTKQADGFIGGIAGKLGIAQNFSKTMAGGIADFASNLAESGMSAEILSASFFSTFNFLNLASSLLEKIVESTIAVAIAADAAASNFQRATGFAGEIQMDLAAISRAGIASGVSLEDAGQAMGSLANNFSAFNPTANETNIQLASTVTLLGKTGVSADQAAQTMDFFNRVMGESPMASARMTRQLALAGTGIGITTSKMLSDFEAVNGYLIGFGDRTTDVFINLQAQSKATGIAIGSLVGIAQKFDAFDSAAVAVGSLNAALGTNLSTIDMINMSTDERLAMLAQEIDFASGGFDNLDRYTQMYVAQAIGAKDAAEAQRLINLQRDPAALSKFNTEMQQQEARQQDLNDLTSKFVPIAEQFKIAVLGLGLAFEPVIVGLTRIFEGIGFLVGGFTNFINQSPLIANTIGILLTFGVVAGVISKVRKVMATTSAVIGALSGTTGALAASQQLQTVTQLEQGAAVGGTAGPIAAGSKLMSKGFSSLATGLIKAGAAALLFGAGIALVGFGVSQAVPHLIDMFGVLVDNLGILPQLALSMALLGPAFTAFGAGVAIGATSLALATPFLMFANLALSSMADTIERLGAGFTAIGAGIQSAVSAVSQIQNLTDDDSFFAVTTDGSKVSMVSAKGGTLTNFSSENITVDVKIPEINIPTPEVNVYIGSEKLNTLITEVVNKRLGGL
jgi:hypothetical protein